MRRHDKELTDPAQIDAIIARARFCRIAMCDGDRPYVVPLCFGRDGDALYMHSAPKGRKLAILRRNPKVCFEMAVDTELVEAAEACKWSFRYRSVIGDGTATIIDEPAGKRAALAVIMNQYSDGTYEVPPHAVDQMVVIRVDIITMTGKTSGY